MDPIPKFIVDLSKPPQSRYDDIIPQFKEQIEDCDIAGIFHALLDALAGPKLGKCLKVVSRLTLRRLYNAEETAELEGFSKAAAIPMHVLVAFNVLLDLLLGCTSGGARILEPKTSTSARRSKVVHFRTLDWGMDELRKIIVELDFVRSPGGPVIATTVGYLGYVGVLTGVRKGLSMSLNFRPYHCRDTWRKRLSFRWQQLMVALGFRQSISSALRETLLGKTSPRDQGSALEKNETTNDGEDVNVPDLISNLSTSPSTAAYLIFCTPEKVFIVEKDHRAASVRESDSFLTAFNHDANDEVNPRPLKEAAAELSEGGDTIGMAEIIGMSLDRKDRLDKLWKKRVRACRRRHKTGIKAITFPDVISFLEQDEINNDETHFAVIMDPTEGTVVWRQAYEVESTESETGSWEDEGSSLEEAQ